MAADGYSISFKMVCAFTVPVSIFPEKKFEEIKLGNDGMRKYQTSQNNLKKFLAEVIKLSDPPVMDLI